MNRNAHCVLCGVERGSAFQKIVREFVSEREQMTKYVLEKTCNNKLRSFPRRCRKKRHCINHAPAGDDILGETRAKNICITCGVIKTSAIIFCNFTTENVVANGY